MERETVFKGIESELYDLETESRLARAGLKDEQNLAQVAERYAWLSARPVIDFVAEELRGESEAGEREQLRRAYYYLLSDYLFRAVAPLDDEVTNLQMQAVVEIDGEQIAYHNVRTRTANEPEFERRERLIDATLPVLEKCNPIYYGMLQKQLTLLHDTFGFAGYVDYCSQRKALHYEDLRQRLAAFLQQTTARYHDLVDPWVHARTGRHLGNIRAGHWSYVSKMGQFDGWFPRERLLPVAEQTLRGLGIDLLAQRNVQLDTEDRDKKNPRAVCYAPNPPHEVHLLIKPVGGLQDYASFLHEAGHTEHYANVDPDAPFAFRVLGTSYALTEIYSFLLQYLTLDPLWLERVAGLERVVAREVAYYTTLEDFYMVRRYVAKLLYELGFFAAPLHEARNRALYAETLSTATGMGHPPERFLDDMDGEFYSADYLRAWISEAMVRDYLKKHFGELWFENPAAGGFLRDLWHRGESIENEALVKELGYEPFDTSYLQRQFMELSPA